MSEPLLQVNAVTKTFGGLHAVFQVSFHIAPGEIIGLIGPNGAGKTTLFNVISGFYAPNKGHIHFRGQDISGKPPYKLATLGIGRTFQVVKPFAGLTVLENVIIASFALAALIGQIVFGNPQFILNPTLYVPPTPGQ